MAKKYYPSTPDGRYFVAKERLWRHTDPSLAEEKRKRLVRELMQARRTIRDERDDAERAAARERVHNCKVALGERGPVWWSDGAPDETQKHPANSTYANWWARLGDEELEAGCS